MIDDKDLDPTIAALLAEAEDKPLAKVDLSVTSFTPIEKCYEDESNHIFDDKTYYKTALKEAASQARAQKTETASTDPYIITVTDKVTGDTGAVRAGSVMEITGSRLKFDAADAEQGVFAITASGEARCEPVLENKPARLMVMLPANTEAGEFSIEVRTKIIGSTGKALKTMKRSIFNKTLTAVKE